MPALSSAGTISQSKASLNLAYTSISGSTHICHKVRYIGGTYLYSAENLVEEYDAELERMNNAMTIENQGLQYDNKQLNSLLKEYEQTLENIMSSFRKRAVS